MASAMSVTCGRKRRVSESVARASMQPRRSANAHMKGRRTHLELVEAQDARLASDFARRHDDPVLGGAVAEFDEVALLVDVHHELVEVDPPRAEAALARRAAVLVGEVRVEEVHEERLAAPDRAEEVQALWEARRRGRERDRRRVGLVELVGHVAEEARAHEAVPHARLDGRRERVDWGRVVAVELVVHVLEEGDDAALVRVVLDVVAGDLVVVSRGRAERGRRRRCRRGGRGAARRVGYGRMARTARWRRGLSQCAAGQRAGEVRRG